MTWGDEDWEHLPSPRVQAELDRLAAQVAKLEAENAELRADIDARIKAARTVMAGRDRISDGLVDRIKELHAQLAEARSLLESLVDDTDCWLDHHGYCQEHYTTPSLGEQCPNQAARDLLATLTDATQEG